MGRLVAVAAIEAAGIGARIGSVWGVGWRSPVGGVPTPGCCQGFYRDASEPVSIDDSRGLEAGPVDMARVHASAEKNGGIENIWPPPFTQLTQAEPRSGRN